MTPEQCKKLSLAMKGKTPWNKGIPATWVKKGADTWNWKGGVTPEYKKIRKSVKYKQWRTAVFKRDNYTCVQCGGVGGRLNADHIKPFSEYADLRFDLPNGRTLCVPCHMETDTWGFKLVWKMKASTRGKYE